MRFILFEEVLSKVYEVQTYIFEVESVETDLEVDDRLVHFEEFADFFADWGLKFSDSNVVFDSRARSSSGSPEKSSPSPVN